MKRRMKKGEIGEILLPKKKRKAHGSQVTQNLAGKKPVVKKVCVASLQDCDSWFVIFKFRRHDGCWAFLAMSSADASVPKKVGDALRDAGARGNCHFSFAALVERLSISTVPATGKILIRGGWDVVGKRFALPDRMLGKCTGGKDRASRFICVDFDSRKDWQLVVKNGSPGVSHLNIGCEGSTELWQRKVAKRALASSPTMLGICAAFAAPLLRLLGIRPYTIIFTGRTTGGKTTATLAGSSVIGLGDEDRLPTWNITPAGLEQRAEIHFDLMLPIDDLNNAKGTVKHKLELIKDVTYQITAGARKFTLTTAKSGITGRPPVKSGIATIILTSAEDSLNEMAVKAKATLPTGVHARLIEIPIPVPELGGVFDRVPLLPTEKATVKANRKLSKAIQSACAKYHGRVLREFIRAIIKDPDLARKSVIEARGEYMAQVKLNRKDALSLRHADRFAFLFGAGAFAIELGLLPWTKAELHDAVSKCHSASKATLPRKVLDLDDGLKRLRSVLTDTQRLVPAAKVRGLKAIYGWQESRAASTTYFVLGDHFRRAFGSKTQLNLVVDFLKKGGFLVPGKNGPTKQPVEPRTGKKAPRCYELRAPSSDVERWLKTAS